MILGNRKILKEIKKQNIIITPFNINQLNSNSYNVKLYNKLYIYKDYELDCKKENELIEIIIPEDGLVLQPKHLYLGRTIEYTETKKYIPMIEGRSSIGRLGIDVHITAGFGDIGFNGYWTLEIRCTKPVKIYPNIEIAQLYYVECKDSNKLYNGKYQNNNGIQGSMLYKELDKN